MPRARIGILISSHPTGWQDGRFSDHHQAHFAGETNKIFSQP
jgi:hypothetical protein